MNTVNEIQNRIETERKRIYQSSFVNNKGEGVPLIFTVDISIQEMKELLTSPVLEPQQKEIIKKKIRSYYKGVNWIGNEKRVLPVINQYGVITIWID